MGRAAELVTVLSGPDDPRLPPSFIALSSSSTCCTTWKIVRHLRRLEAALNVWRTHRRGGSAGEMKPSREEVIGELDAAAYSTTTAGFESSPIWGTLIVTTSPGTSLASSVTMMPVPVDSTDPAGT